MEHDFWHNKWAKNEIGFHLAEANPLLIKFYDQLQTEQGSRIFLPLCGKTRDIPWLMSQGCHVIGAELSQRAVDQLFEELKIVPRVSVLKKQLLYSADNIDIFVGDIFDLRAEQIGAIDAVYDRAALIALPDEIRLNYTKHLMQITANAQQLLVVIDYDQSILKGPPFALNENIIKDYYKQDYRLSKLQSSEIEGGLKGKCDANEVIYLLERK